MVDLKLNAQVLFGDNLEILKSIPDDSIDLIYIEHFQKITLVT